MALWLSLYIYALSLSLRFVIPGVSLAVPPGLAEQSLTQSLSEPLAFGQPGVTTQGQTTGLNATFPLFKFGRAGVSQQTFIFYSIVPVMNLTHRSSP